MKAKFGPAGNSKAFYDDGNTASVQMPEYLKKIGLNAYEYQCGKGVNISKSTASILGENAKKNGIELSVHAPYYINLANPDSDKQKATINYIFETLSIARQMGATRIVVHSGSIMKMSREYALEVAKQTLKQAIAMADSQGFSDIVICPETMGKINQLGDLNEVMQLCMLDERLLPTIDFGHLNARTLGGLKTLKDFEDIFDVMENAIGIDRMRVFHSHFSKIEYTKGGEKVHLTFADNLFGPDFEPVSEIICKKNLTPTIICESDGTQTDDALIMKQMYEKRGC